MARSDRAEVKPHLTGPFIAYSMPLH
jgi:hypothetical protein